jgi:hypothetical protein
MARKIPVVGTIAGRGKTLSEDCTAKIANRSYDTRNARGAQRDSIGGKRFSPPVRSALDAVARTTIPDFWSRTPKTSWQMGGWIPSRAPRLDPKLHEHHSDHDRPQSH